jgi:hypothetical protein
MQRINIGNGSAVIIHSGLVTIEVTLRPNGEETKSTLTLSKSVSSHLLAGKECAPESFRGTLDGLAALVTMALRVQAATVAIMLSKPDNIKQAMEIYATGISGMVDQLRPLLK